MQKLNSGDKKVTSLQVELRIALLSIPVLFSITVINIISRPKWELSTIAILLLLVIVCIGTEMFFLLSPFPKVAKVPMLVKYFVTAYICILLVQLISGAGL